MNFDHCNQFTITINLRHQFLKQAIDISYQDLYSIMKGPGSFRAEKYAKSEENKVGVGVRLFCGFGSTWNSTYPREVHAELQLGQQV